MPDLPSMLFYPHYRAFSVNLFFQCQGLLCFAFMFSKHSDTSSFSPEPCISMSLFLSLDLDFFPVSPLQASSAASNWAQISCFCLAPHPLLSLHYRLIYFPSLPIHISVVPGLLFAILIISMLFWSLLYFSSVLTLSICISTSSIDICCSEYFCSFLSLHTSPAQDTYSLAPLLVSSLIFIFADLYTTTNKLSL